jgi:hypothetical protein
VGVLKTVRHRCDRFCLVTIGRARDGHPPRKHLRFCDGELVVLDAMTGQDQIEKKAGGCSSMSSLHGKGPYTSRAEGSIP